jgi:hypothetical protein
MYLSAYPFGGLTRLSLTGNLFFDTDDSSTMHLTYGLELLRSCLGRQQQNHDGEKPAARSSISVEPFCHIIHNTTLIGVFRW